MSSFKMQSYEFRILSYELMQFSLPIHYWSTIKNEKRQVTYIAPLNRIPLLSSDPGGVL